MPSMKNFTVASLKKMVLELLEKETGGVQFETLANVPAFAGEFPFGFYYENEGKEEPAVFGVCSMNAARAVAQLAIEKKLFIAPQPKPASNVQQRVVIMGKLMKAMPILLFSAEYKAPEERKLWWNEIIRLNKNTPFLFRKILKGINGTQKKGRKKVQ